MLKNVIEQLNTGYFAIVMATEIISIALLLTNHYVLSETFFYLGICAYILFIILYCTRVFYFPKKVWGDLQNASSVFGYFTFVAGTNVLGTCFAYASQYRIALLLGVLGTVCWVILTYFVLMVLLFYNQYPAMRVLNGTWLLASCPVLFMDFCRRMDACGSDVLYADCNQVKKFAEIEQKLGQKQTHWGLV